MKTEDFTALTGRMKICLLKVSQDSKAIEGLNLYWCRATTFIKIEVIKMTLSLMSAYLIKRHNRNT